MKVSLEIDTTERSPGGETEQESLTFDLMDKSQRKLNKIYSQ